MTAAILWIPLSRRPRLPHPPVPSPDPTPSPDPKERVVIDTAVRSIQQWNILCEQGVSIAMSSNVDIQNIARINSALKTKTSSINNAVTVLTSKFSAFHL